MLEEFLEWDAACWAEEFLERNAARWADEKRWAEEFLVRDAARWADEKEQSLHAGVAREQAREQALKTLKMVLVYTDECARDIDTPDVAMVVKFNMPKLIDDYVHRICRAGCAGNKGSATSFVRTFLLKRARKYHHSSMTLPGMGNGDYVSRYQDRWTRKGRTAIGILQGIGIYTFSHQIGLRVHILILELLTYLNSSVVVYVYVPFLIHDAYCVLHMFQNTYICVSE